MQNFPEMKFDILLKETMKQNNPTIVFVCEHGAAKSIIAAAYFNKLAQEKNLNAHAIARGTHPDPEVSPKAITGLKDDGLSPTERVPQQLSRADVQSAQRIISFCELPAEFQAKVSIERWGGVPPVSAGYQKARDSILEHINQLLKQQENQS
jgi:arsenate reductase (thioredoxin)